MGDVILKIENVSKQYQLGQFGTGTIGRDVDRWWRTKVLKQEDPFLKIGAVNDRTSKEKENFVWALKDINFEVRRGEILGVIGKNGAGKSTLLKLLSRVTSPTTGTIRSAGRMASLLEVGTGFHPELTGRENIFLNGAILGMTKKEINSKFDEIVDFSGCELYIDTPTKRYSSGMTVRLGFAVAAFLDPEILIVDEVLAVGDAEFQKKAIGKMKEVSSSGGRTVLFVSHNMASISSLCTKSILMENGKIKNVGNTKHIISQYLLSNSQSNAYWKIQNKTNSELYFEEITVIDNLERITSNIASGTNFKIKIKLVVLEKIDNSAISIRFINDEGIVVFTTASHDLQNLYDEIYPGAYDIFIDINPNILVPGNYSLVFSCFVSRVKLFDVVENKIGIEIEDLGIKNKDQDRKGLVIPIFPWKLNISQE
jgi:lipopolysaccharide transport system ATP-binding protein